MEKLTKGMDPVFLEYMKICRKYKFEEEPDYKMLSDLFLKRFEELNFIEDG